MHIKNTLCCICLVYFNKKTIHDLFLIICHRSFFICDPLLPYVHTAAYFNILLNKFMKILKFIFHVELKYYTFYIWKQIKYTSCQICTAEFGLQKAAQVKTSTSHRRFVDIISLRCSPVRETFYFIQNTKNDRTFASYSNSKLDRYCFYFFKNILKHLIRSDPLHREKCNICSTHV